MKFKKIVSSFLGGMMLAATFLQIGTKEVKAEVVNYGVSPSSIQQVVMEQGQSKFFKFKVGNKSSYDVNLNIDVYPSLENQDKIPHIKIDDMVFVDKSTVTIGKDNVAEVIAKIKAPNDLPKGQYKLYLNFTRKPLENENKDNIANIKVPINLFVGTVSDYEKLKESYEIVDNYISFNDEKLTKNTVTTRQGYIKKYLKELLFKFNPIEVENVFKEIKNKPIYAFIENNEIKYDLSQNIDTEMINVLAKNEGKIGDWQYIYIDKSLFSQKIKDVKFYNDTVIIELESNKVELILKNEIVKSIENQYNSRTFQKNDLTLERFLNKVYVPINRTYSSKLKYNIDITNNGEKPVFSEGTFELKNRDEQKIFDSLFSKTRIDINSTKNLALDLPINKFKYQGFYELESFLKINGTKDEKVEQIIELKNIRLDVYKKTLILYCIYLFLVLITLVIIIRCGYKAYKKHKENKREKIIEDIRKE